MRDPLYRVPVKYKLVLMMATVCLLALGVGGFLVSHSAESSLQEEIKQRLEFQARAYATALDANMEMLARRTEDFASDGHIRSLLTRLLECRDPSRERRLRADLSLHLRTNKLPLVPAFVDLTVLGDGGRIQVSPHADSDPPSRRFIKEALTHDRTWCAGIIPAEREDLPLLTAVSTPLRSLDGKRRIGALISWIHPGIWIASALEKADLKTRREGVSLSISDRAGRQVQVSSVLTEATGPSSASEAVRSGFGVRLMDESSPAGRSPTREHPSVFSRSFPISSNGWTVRVEQETRALQAAVTALQNRFLAVGLILALGASLLLFFPMRFLARPLTRMTEAVSRIRNGELSTRVEVTSEDEIGKLAQGLNHMADAVEERTKRLERTAAELQRESERLAAVISSMRDGLVVLDADGQPVISNAAARPLLQILASGQGATSHNACLAPDNPEGSGDCAHCLFDLNGPDRTCIMDIGRRAFEVHASRLASDGNGRLGRVLVSRDISDRIAEDERHIHQERLAVLGEVAAVMAHELNNPLASIKMFAQMLEEDVHEDEGLREKARVILRNTDTCKRAIRELLEYATNATPEIGEVDLHEVISDVIRFLRPVRERAEIEVSADLRATCPQVMGDEVQIRQILVNLVVNAIQAIGENGTITISTRNAGDYLEVDVADTGPGVPEESREDIFKPFFTTKSRGEGTGLGLPTARRIAELQGGSLELLPPEESGATFRIRLRCTLEGEV